ncbi:hypothetical protein QBC34DRAFT_453465 [Podospora aff. communis PSN243]|uniref:Nuclear GTPase SLIP-GC n=1 Tax=Podospora aff. communis PSN243 TaxID=3040156 RepID=A0AAV9H8E9_9PEZI|nr:hypothetical protein QBC34DRAFT_453465 [Podospora aff. communis PSN243]
MGDAVPQVKPERVVEQECVRRLAEETDLARLEAGIAPALRTLEDIKDAITKQAGIHHLTSLGPPSELSPSQIHPAVLNEEEVVPTNGMRACTAVITEVRYNHSEDPAEKYRAEIHFISEKEWTKELHVLHADLSSDGQECDAKIAASKICAVYPGVSETLSTLDKEAVADLAKTPDVARCLGTVEKLSAPDCRSLLQQVRKYIDSKDKKSSGEADQGVMEYWPLVKVVKIFTKSAVLKNGLVLVDLPGSRDSNAARSAVAANYIERCTGIWIVVPINRAVDDQTAQKLMTDNLRQQLQLDGTCSTVTFICTKTDDITVTEASNSMAEDSRIHRIHEELQVLKRQEEGLKEETANLMSRMELLSDEIETLDDDINSIDSALQNENETAEKKDEVDISSLQSTRKRKRQGSDLVLGQGSLNVDDGQGSDPGSTATGEEGKLILSMERAKAYREELNSKKRAFVTEKNTMRKETISKLSDNLESIRLRIKNLDEEHKSECIKHRNNYSRQTMGVQYAKEVRELDQDRAQARDGESFDPSHQERDYQQLAETLPVFCVSSKAYLKMSGWRSKDETVSGFPRVQDTEIPSLREHALKMTEAAWSAKLRKFYDALHEYLIDITMYVGMSCDSPELALDRKLEETRFLDEAFSELSTGFRSEIDATFQQARAEINGNIFERFEPAIRIAKKEAQETAAKWSLTRNQGGLAFATYRATCIREGFFERVNITTDFNADLCKPLVRTVAAEWEDFFTKKFPKDLVRLCERLALKIDAVKAQMQERSVFKASVKCGYAKWKAESLAKDIRDASLLTFLVQEGQKRANRSFADAIQQAMLPGYQRCAEQTGSGCYKRMKAEMERHISRVRSSMFRAATANVREMLDGLLSEIEKTVASRAKSDARKMKTSLQMMLNGKNLFEDFPKLAHDIQEMLKSTNGRFEDVYRDLDIVESETKPETKSEIPA